MMQYSQRLFPPGGGGSGVDDAVTTDRDVAGGTSCSRRVADQFAEPRDADAVRVGAHVQPVFRRPCRRTARQTLQVPMNCHSTRCFK